eukprot:1812147-Pleurochrysis_carterae.AAC.1
MDMLAAASVAVSLHEGNAVQILNDLRASLGERSPVSTGSVAGPPASPSSESTSATQIAVHAWHQREEEELHTVVKKHIAQTSSLKKNGSDGPELLSEPEGRSAQQSRDRWKEVQTEIVKGPWCPKEDAQLRELVAAFGGKNWARIASMLPGRGRLAFCVSPMQ